MHFISAVTAAAALFAAGSFAAPHRPGFGGHPEFGGRPSLGDRTQFTRPPLQTLTTIECKCATTSLVEPTTTAEPIVDGTTSSATTTGAINTASSFIPGPTPSFEACMTDNEASEVAEVFRQIIQGYTIEMAMAALTEDFVDYTSAVSIIVNKGGSAPKDLLVPIFTNRTQFMAGHGTQKGIPFETLNVWHDCNGTVSMRWWTSRSGQGQPTESAAIVSQQLSLVVSQWLINSSPSSASPSSRPSSPSPTTHSATSTAFTRCTPSSTPLPGSSTTGSSPRARMSPSLLSRLSATSRLCRLTSARQCTRRGTPTTVLRRSASFKLWQHWGDVFTVDIIGHQSMRYGDGTRGSRLHSHTCLLARRVNHILVVLSIYFSLHTST